MDYKRDFETVYVDKNVKQDQFDVRKEIKAIMELNGYNTEGYDICSVSTEWHLEEVDVKFKFVHFSVPSMASMPYYHIIFKEA